MKQRAMVLGTLALAAIGGVALAHDGHDGPGPGGGPPSPQDPSVSVAMHLARMADADKSGDVTADEWKAFLASLQPDANGVISLAALIAALPVPENGAALQDTPDLEAKLTQILDRNVDGKVTVDDLNAFFALLDRNGDGALNASDRPAPPPAPHPDRGDQHKAATVLARAADADKSGDVTADEWKAFLAKVGTDPSGAVDLTALAALLPTPPRHEDKGGGPSATDVAAMLTRVFDQNGDGTVTVADLNALFASLDANGDGALSASEIGPPPWLHGVACSVGVHLAQAADTNQDGTVSADERAAFLAGLVVDASSGAVSLDDLATKLQVPAPPSGDTGKRDQMLTHALDVNHDGVVTLDDLRAIFNALDRNGDGAIDSSDRSGMKKRRHR